MKHLLPIFSVFFIFCASPSFSETRKQAVLVNVGTIVVGNYEATYEHRLDKRFSISAAAIYYDARAVPFRVFSFGYMIGLGFMPKIHVYGHAHENSFYLAPSFKLGYLVHPPREEKEQIDKGILVRLGGNFGYQHVFGFGLMIDAMAGLEHYHNFSLTRTASRYQNEIDLLIRPYFSASIGYAF